MALTTDTSEQFTVGGKISRGIWTTLAGLLVGVVATASASYSTDGDIGAVTAAAESHAQTTARTEIAAHRADTERAMLTQRAEMDRQIEAQRQAVAATLSRGETVQREMAGTVTELGKAVSRIEGRLEARPRR